jgi:hypothetical protein
MPASYSSQNSPHYHERDVVPEWPRRSRPAAQRNDQVTTTKRSTGRRLLRGFFRLVFAILLGVVGTLAWQSYGEEAKATIRTWAPSLVWLFPASKTTPLDGQASAATAVTSADLAQQIKPVALDLAIVRYGVDQLAATIKRRKLLHCRQPSRTSKKRCPPQLSPVQQARARHRNRQASHRLPGHPCACWTTPLSLPDSQRG